MRLPNRKLERVFLLPEAVSPNREKVQLGAEQDRVQNTIYRDINTICKQRASKTLHLMDTVSTASSTRSKDYSEIITVSNYSTILAGNAHLLHSVSHRQK
uniref:Uncharacterized protein n=1 Tax=Sphaerodactylus townsendi TaxID=933632 RepID=A0ACB8F2D8_9SAUR